MNVPLKRLAIISTHPIQYNAPWFRLLAERQRIEVMVFYTWSQVEKGPKYDPGFNQVVDWDIPLLDGYSYRFVENISKNPGTRSHNGIQNPTLVKAVEDYNPDCILVMGWNFQSHLQCLKYFYKKIPVFFRGDSTLLDKEPLFKSLLKKFYLSKIYGLVDYALYVGSANKRYFKRYGLKETQLVFVPHAIDNERFGKEPAELNGLRAKLGIRDEETLILYAGKLEEKKDPLLLLNAFKRMNVPDLHLLFVGNGPLEENLKSVSGQLLKVHYLDFQNQSQMPATYKAADIFVLPSKGPGETWGLAVNEAMACSKPVIVSNKCGCAEDLVENGINGYIFNGGDLFSLQESLETIIKDHGRLKVMGQRSQQKILDFNFNKIVSTIEDLVLHTA